jgi:hypothetical protein
MDILKERNDISWKDILDVITKNTEKYEGKGIKSYLSPKKINDLEKEYKKLKPVNKKNPKGERPSGNLDIFNLNLLAKFARTFDDNKVDSEAVELLDEQLTLNSIRNAILSAKNKVEEYPVAKELLFGEKQPLYYLDEILKNDKKPKVDKDVIMLIQILTGNFDSSVHIKKVKFLEQIADSVNRYFNNRKSSLPKKYRKVINNNYQKNREILYKYFNEIKIDFKNEYVSDASSEVVNAYLDFKYEEAYEKAKEIISKYTNTKKISESEYKTITSKKMKLLFFELGSDIVILEEELPPNSILENEDSALFKETVNEIKDRIEVMDFLFKISQFDGNRERYIKTDPIKKERLTDINEAIRNIDELSSEIDLLEIGSGREGYKLSDLIIEENEEDSEGERRKDAIREVEERSEEGEKLTTALLPSDGKRKYEYIKRNTKILDYYKESAKTRKKLFNGIMSKNISNKSKDAIKDLTELNNSLESMEKELSKSTSKFIRNFNKNLEQEESVKSKLEQETDEEKRMLLEDELSKIEEDYSKIIEDEKNINKMKEEYYSMIKDFSKYGRSILTDKRINVSQGRDLEYTQRTPFKENKKPNLSGKTYAELQDEDGKTRNYTDPTLNVKPLESTGGSRRSKKIPIKDKKTGKPKFEENPYFIDDDKRDKELANQFRLFLRDNKKQYEESSKWLEGLGLKTKNQKII